ncbi:uncharacterized protein C20orf204 homolog isoform 2-T2 [Morphnus guianensis]
MILPRALSCAVLLLLLVAVLSRGKRCSIAKILRQYRAVIFHEIQNLKNLSRSAERSPRAGPACRSDKVSTNGPRAGMSCGLSPQGAVEPLSLPRGRMLFSSPGPEDPALHLQHQHVPAGGGGRHPARPRGAGGVEGGQKHRLRAQGELQENQQEPAAHPGTAPARGTRPQEKAAAGDWEESREAGDLLGEALRPARIPPCPPGLVGMPSPSAGGTRCSGTVAAGFLFGNLGQIQS